MKKTISIFMVIIMLLSLSAYGKSALNESRTDVVSSNESVQRF